MYLPPNRLIESDDIHNIPLNHRLLSSPISPDEEELLFPASSNNSNSNNNNKYFWNDLATLQSQMLELLPFRESKVFQNEETIKEKVGGMEFHQPRQRLLRAYRATQTYLQEHNLSESDVHVHFFRVILDCPPMHLGFHTDCIPEWCYCPLSLSAAWSRNSSHKEWYHKYSKQLQSACRCCKRGPSAFMAHVRAMQQDNQPPLVRELHAIFEVYLKAYYEHYVVPHYWHEGFYPLYSDEYNEVMSRKLFRMHRQLELGQEARERLKNENEEKQKKLHENQRVKEVCRKVLHKTEMEHREKYHSFFQRVQVTLGVVHGTAKERHPYSQNMRVNHRHNYRKNANRIFLEYFRFNRQELKVQFENSSMEYMERLWNERDHLYLFARDTSQLPESFFGGINASPNHDPLNEEKDYAIAKDDGGPTRQFLSVFWRYLPRINLKVKDSNGNEIDFSVFKQENNFLVPKSDYDIKRLQQKGQLAVHTCYLALGRILGFCFLHEYHISHNVLSKIHRNYLFRGLTPMKGYDRSDLFYDLKENLGQQTAENNKTFEDLQALLDFDNETDFEQKLRNYFHETYIDQFMFFLDSVQKGMRLDFMEADRIPQTFKDTHSWRVDELLFGKSTFDVEDVIAALQPDYADSSTLTDNAETRKRIETQKKVLRKNAMSKAEGVFVDVIRSEAEKDKDFLATFVLFVLGYDYLPVGVPIIVEFNHYELKTNDGFPMAHTCVHVLKLPGLAYNADKELIRAKLNMALENLKNSKSAFNII